ncbi:unnamed protein product [Cuscuta epithymum]|uniref:Uncharacterized protein n=1 Tax=Cuscuta epithymum TaxID=186058 RepID=A0AAV0E383_9ASTE|nr:unnamed protein product [Cuscuta epithymum]
MMPQTWRILKDNEVLSEKFNIPFEALDIGYTYDLRTSRIGRYTLTAKDNREAIVSCVDKVNDRGWQTKFFFVQRSSLHPDGSFLEDAWLNGDKGSMSLRQGLEAEERTRWMLVIGMQDGLYPS